jgi:hypothetical protein
VVPRWLLAIADEVIEWHLGFAALHKSGFGGA